MVASFIGVEYHFQKYVSYSVDHSDQFYTWHIVESVIKHQ
jgi:hypothetical protein